VIEESVHLPLHARYRDSLTHTHAHTHADTPYMRVTETYATHLWKRPTKESCRVWSKIPYTWLNTPVKKTYEKDSSKRPKRRQWCVIKDTVYIWLATFFELPHERDLWKRPTKENFSVYSKIPNTSDSPLLLNCLMKETYGRGLQMKETYGRDQQMKFLVCNQRYRIHLTCHFCWIALWKRLMEEAYKREL